ncbi:MAG: Ni/Fe-hydrogenase, b-type cytochrome subunit [Acidobacteriota bacterium]|nr:Ni/Fe-hydrogenase, b-type cytochrome subunit [Acidobacteriota bacterium]
MATTTHTTRMKMTPAGEPLSRHPRMRIGPTVAVYVWQYPLRLAHWGFVLSIAGLAFTGYYIHNPFIVGQTKTPFLMGWFRFAHEALAGVFITCFFLRMHLMFFGDRWARWRAMVPIGKDRFKEMWEMVKFYLFIRPTPVSRIGHNAVAALSYIAIYALMFVEIVTGLVMYNWLRHSPVLTPLVGWIPGFVNIQTIRLIHFFLMYVFTAFGVIHVHMCLMVSSVEKRGLIDSIFTGYKNVPVDELEEDDRKAIAAARGERVL